MGSKTLLGIALGTGVLVGYACHSHSYVGPRLSPMIEGQSIKEMVEFQEHAPRYKKLISEYGDPILSGGLAAAILIIGYRIDKNDWEERLKHIKWHDSED